MVFYTSKACWSSWTTGKLQDQTHFPRFTRSMKF